MDSDNSQPCARPEAGERGARYLIRVGGHLDSHWSAWLEGVTITHDPDGSTLLEGPLADQARLHGLLNKLQDLHLTLLSVQRKDR